MVSRGELIIKILGIVMSTWVSLGNILVEQCILLSQ
jgi:hypothetical protein